MAFSDPLALNDSTPAAQSFVRQSAVSGGSDYIESDATAALTRRLTIRYQNAGQPSVKGAKPPQRSTLVLIVEKYNSTTGKTDKAQVSVSFVYDPATSITETDLIHAKAMAVDFFYSAAGTARLQQMLRKE